MLRQIPETYEEKAGEIDLLPCPFCGTDEARFTSCQELEACEDRKCPEESHYHAVVCSFAGKGCGASSGFYPTYGEAAAAWNRRCTRNGT